MIIERRKVYSLAICSLQHGNIRLISINMCLNQSNLSAPHLSFLGTFFSRLISPIYRAGTVFRLECSGTAHWNTFQRLQSL